MDDKRPYLQQLVADLTTAQAITPNLLDVQSQRDRLTEVAAALVKFLRQEGVPTALYQPLHVMCAALVDVAEGRHNPLFEPQKMAPGAERKLRLEAQQLGVAAALVDIFKNELQMSGTEAHKQAARAIDVDWMTLRNFRKTIGKGTAPASAVEAYGWIKRDLRGLPSYNPKDGAAYVLKKLSEIQKGQ